MSSLSDKLRYIAKYPSVHLPDDIGILKRAADELERLTAEEKMQLEQIVNQGLEIERLTGASKSYEAQANKDCLEIERLTAELTTSRYWREQEVKDLTAELAEMKADRDSLSVAAALWNHRYIDACQQHNDRQTNLGHQIVALEDERDALKAALQLIKANTNTADWPDDINAAIQGAGK